MDFLRDPIWQFIGVIVALVALFSSVIFYIKQRSLKRFTYQIISNTSIVNIEKDLKDKLQIIFNGKAVEDAHLVILKIWNSGNASILPADFEKPINLVFGDKAEVLEVVILETFPDSIKNNISFEKSSDGILLEPLLLNSKEWIILKVLLTHFAGNIKVNVRVNGLNQVLNWDDVYKERIDRLERLLTVSGIILTAPTFLVFYNILKSPYSFIPILFIAFIVIFIFTLIGYIFNILITDLRR